MGSTKYYKMLDAYLDFYTDYVNTSTDLMCASVMLDANDLPVLILVSKPDDDGVSTFSFYGFEKNKVIFISNCNSYLTYSHAYTDGIVYLYNDSSVWYQIKDNQMYKIEDGNGYYMDGEKIAEITYNDDSDMMIYSYYIDGKRIDITDDTYDSYSEKIENLCIEYYTSIYGDDVINSYLELRSVYELCMDTDLDFLSAELLCFSDLYESGYGNNYVDFQMLISELKEMTDVNQKEFYFTTVNYFVENGYSDSGIGDWAAVVILHRDTSWMPDLLEAWGKWLDYNDYEGLVGELCMELSEDEIVPRPNVSYTSEQVFGTGNDSATREEIYSGLYYIASSVTEAKVEEMLEQYGISEDVIYGIIDWWHSDEYISAIDTALETRLEYLDAVSADSSLIGYWECGDEMLKIYYSEDEGGLVIDADVAEKTGIPAGNYYCYGYDYGGNYGDYYDYYEFEEYFLENWCIEKGVEYVSMKFTCESTSRDVDGYFYMILTCVDDNTLEIKFTSKYYGDIEYRIVKMESGEAVDVSVTSTFTRHTLTEEEIAVINAKEAYADYMRNIDYDYFVIVDITGDDIPEVFYAAGECRVVYIDSNGELQDIKIEAIAGNFGGSLDYCKEGVICIGDYGGGWDESLILQFDGGTFKTLHNLYEYNNGYDASVQVGDEEYHNWVYLDDVEYSSYDEAFAVFENYCNEYGLTEIEWIPYGTFQEELEAYGN